MRKMKKIINVHVYKGDRQYVAECHELPVVTQGKTVDEVLRNVEEALRLHLSGEDLSELDLVQDPAVIANIELEPVFDAKT